MLVYGRWKYALAIAILLLSTLYSLPNLYPQDPSVQITASRGAQIDDAFKAQVAASIKAAGVTPKQTEVQKDGNLLVRLSSPNDQVKAADSLRASVGSDYVVALNLASTVPDWLTAVGAKPMLLGLDLQGGVHFLMQVDQKAAMEKRLNAYTDDLRVVLRDNNVRYESVNRRPDGSMVATLLPGADVAAAQKVVTKNLTTLQNDVSGNTIIVTVPERELQAITNDAIEQNVGTLRNRINELGVAEPLIQRQGTDRVVVELPGVQDTAQAKRILGATATLEYRAVVKDYAYDEVTSGNIPPEGRLYYRKEIGPDGKPIPIILNKRVIASGDQLVTAHSGFDSQSGTPQVTVKLNGVGGQRMFDFTSENVGKPMAVLYIERIPVINTVDGKEIRTTRTREQVISVANIQGVFGKDFSTTGLDSPKESADLALLLRAGALAAPMDFVEERIVGPSLGAENIRNGVRAVGYSFIFALVFFLIYYRLFGVITCLALLLNLLMLVAIMSVMGATMTLPGLAGIALTVGMSVDANVLINERIREDWRAGMPPLAAISEGYKRATTTIVDANITTVLAGVALFAFGTGPIKGFAVTLIVGITTSMYTAVSVSRGISALIYGHRRKLKSISI